MSVITNLPTMYECKITRNNYKLLPGWNFKPLVWKKSNVKVVVFTSVQIGGARLPRLLVGHHLTKGTTYYDFGSLLLR